MNLFVFIICLLFIGPIYSDYSVVYQTPNTTMLPSTEQFVIEINQTVNRPSFPSFIHIVNATNNISIHDIDVHSNLSNVTYVNNTLIFNITGFNINDEIYITLDADVLFSNDSVNSTAHTDSQFWHLKVNDIIPTSTATTLENTPTGTTQSGKTATSMGYSDTSAFTVTVVTITYTSNNPLTQNLNRTSTSPEIMITGEPPPTRSAQIGMGLGITFITILIIVEIVYFKYCYHGDGRSSNYFT